MKPVPNHGPQSPSGARRAVVGLGTQVLRPLTCALVATALAGCTQASPAPPAGTATSGLQPPKVNRVVMAVPPPSTETNSTRMVNIEAMWHLAPMYDFLIGADPQTGRLIPQLATEWRLDSGNVFRLKLRQRVAFQKGAGEFTVKDVLVTHNQLVKTDSLHPASGQWRQLVSSIDAVGDYEAVMHLTALDAGVMELLPQQSQSIPIVSKADYDARGEPTPQNEPLAGTGPYQFLGRAAGSYIRFERTPAKNWRMTPDFPEFEFRFMKEASTRLASLLAGEVHLTSLPQDLVAQVEKQGVMKVVPGKVPGFRSSLAPYCCFLADLKDPSKGLIDSPLNDLRVRQALTKAINRDEMNKAFLGGKGEVMVTPHFHPTRLGWNPEWQTKSREQYGYDAAKARSLLADAGFGPGNPLSTNLFAESTGGLAGGEQDTLEAIAGYWRAVGVNVTLVQLDAPSISKQSNERKFSNHFRMRITGSTQYRAVWSFHTCCQGAPNTTYVYNGEVETLFAQLKMTFDEQRQAELYRKIGDISFKNILEIPLFWLPADAVVNPTFVADYVFPGSITGIWTHIEHIKAAR